MVGQGPNLGLQGIGNTEFVYIDVNGYGKGPNRMGEDLYAFILTNIGELIPVGDKGTIYSSAFCDKNQGWSIDESGMSCSYEVLRNSK